MQWLDLPERHHAARGAPAEEIRTSPRIGPPGVRVTDRGGEEFQESPLRLRLRLGDQFRQEEGR
jgi:hypothetical protein